MNSPLRRRLRHTRRWAAYFLLVLVIGLAVIVGIANQLLPLVERHPQRVAAWLSERVGEKVGFSAARAEWTRRGPRFTLDDLQVGEGNALLSIGSAQLQVAMYSGLLPGRPLTELKIRDLSLTLVQRDDGSWEVIGLPGRGDVDLLERLEGFGELHIEKTQLTISAPALRIDSRIPRVDARIRVNGSRLRVGVAAWSRAGDEPLNAVLDFGRDSGDGLLWVGADNLQLAHWAPLLSGTGVLPQQGNADLGLWARLRDRRVSQVILEADVRQALLRSVRPLLSARGRTRAIRVDFERVQARIRWMATANGWQVHAPRLSVTRAGKVARLDGLMVDVGRQYRLLGEALDLSPLAATASCAARGFHPGLAPRTHAGLAAGSATGTEIVRAPSRVFRHGRSH